MAVITPQVEPPPPRIPQNRSELFTELAVIRVPFAITMSTSRILSTPRPLDGAKGPWPPPVDHPMMPTVFDHPEAINLLLLAAEY